MNQITKELIVEKNQKALLVKAGNIIYKSIKTAVTDINGKVIYQPANWRKDNPLTPPKRKSSESSEKIKDSHSERSLLKPLSGEEKKKAFREKHEENRKKNLLTPALSRDHWSLQL
ncbi:MAG: hypothetical protein IBX72_06930 [Nitrospirae bacterium]|jgi:hypothetical protein|nr:hypothetical protein [Nitrospirota bacterium]